MKTHLLVLLLLSFESFADSSCMLSRSPDDLRSVKVGLFLIDVAEINDVNQEVYVDLYGIAEWQDQRLAECENVELDSIWRPNIEIVNRRNLSTASKLHIDLDGINVRARQRFIGTLAVPLQLADFPIDQQKIFVELVLVERAEEVKLVPAESLSGRKNKFTVAGWRIGEASFDVAEMKGVDGKLFSVARFNLLASREVNYYVWKVIAPLIIIVLMSWTVFWISAEQVAPKIGVSTTSVLTLFAYQLSLTDVLPRIAYLTRMDIFVLGAFVMVLLGLIESLVSVRLAGSGKMERAKMLDKRCRLIFPLLFVPIIVSAFWL